MCFFTVLSDTPARRSISLFVRPAAIPVTISRCRMVSGSAGRIRAERTAGAPSREQPTQQRGRPVHK
jgi:hypothetical protein